MSSQARLVTTLAFVAGVLLTLGFKDFYPDLERRFRRRWPGLKSSTTTTAARSGQETAPHAKDLDHQVVLSNYEIKDGIDGAIGNTPLIRLKSLSAKTGCEILAKCELLNGAGNSPKDRVALALIQKAEYSGLLAPQSGDAIYEGTVGSTGISLAAIGRARGYPVHIFMPNDQATAKYDLLLKLGANVERVPPAPIIDPNHFVNLARSRAAAHTADPNMPGRGYFVDQFETQANWQAHFETTGPEIWEQCGGRLDAFITGAGTGGTISGVAKFLKSKTTRIRIALADPQGSGLYNRIKFGVMFDTKEREGTRRRQQVDTIVEGIGINRVTQNLEAGRELIDNAYRVTDEEAMQMARDLVRHDGIFIGSSSAVNCAAAVKLARELGPGHRIVTVLCDSGTRHLSKFWAKTGDVGEGRAVVPEPPITGESNDPRMHR